MDQFEKADFKERKHRENLQIQQGFGCKLKRFAAAPSAP